MQLDWAPLCGSTMADKLAGKNWVDCLHSTSTAPWGGDRGFYIFILDIANGLMIDVVYTELFNELAEGFVKRLNLRTEQVRT